MPVFRRRREHPEGRRLVRAGDTFTTDELDRGLVELEPVEAAPEPAAEPSHPEVTAHGDD